MNLLIQVRQEANPASSEVRRKLWTVPFIKSYLVVFVGYLGDGKNTKNFVCLLLVLAALAMFAFGSVTGSLNGMIFFPASIALCVGVLCFYIGSDSPEAYGLGKSEDIFEEKISAQDLEVQKESLNKWSTFKKYILKNPFILGLCFANVFVYIVRIGIDQWGIVYAKELLGLSKEVAKSGFTMFEMGALSGVFYLSASLMALEEPSAICWVIRI